MTKQDRKFLGLASVFWFTGLSGVGKSTLAVVVQRRLEESGKRTLLFDGDTIRASLHRHLGFTPLEIKKNNFLIAKLCANSRKDYDVILVPIISPYSEMRTYARQFLGPGFHEIHITAEFSKLESRDPKELYAKARKGQIDNLIGVSPTHQYETPKHPDLVIDTTFESVNESAARLLDYCIKQI